MHEEEAKVAGKVLENWQELIRLLAELQEKWSQHLELVHKMNIDYVDARLQGYMAHGFNRADFYLALPDLVEFARAQGGIEYLQIGKEKKEDGQGPKGRTEGPKVYGRK